MYVDRVESGWGGKGLDLKDNGQIEWCTIWVKNDAKLELERRADTSVPHFLNISLAQNSFCYFDIFFINYC